MLHEIRYVRQERRSDRKRWFTDDYWDLYVWVRGDGSFSGFQLCYGKTDSQRALTWMEGGSPTHSGVSEPKQSGPASIMAAPLLVSDGVFNVRPVAQRFWKESREIDLEVRRYVILKLKSLMQRGAEGETRRAQ